MSYSITGTTITLTRGDTFEALVSATKKDGTPYIPVEGDVIRFAMKENYDDARPLLVKEIPIDTMMCRCMNNIGTIYELPTFLCF